MSLGCVCWTKVSQKVLVKYTGLDSYRTNGVECLITLEQAESLGLEGSVEKYHIACLKTLQLYNVRIKEYRPFRTLFFLIKDSLKVFSAIGCDLKHPFVCGIACREKS